MVSLTGKRVVLAASRKLEEMSLLIEKQGGTPIIRSLQGTVFLAEKEVEPILQRLVDEEITMLIITTGIGLETLIDISEKSGMKDRFLALVNRVDVASRGYKSLAVLKKIGVEPVAVDEDGTTAGLVCALDDYSFEGKKVAVQLHGERAPRLISFLEDRGAEVVQILPYQHIAPKSETVAVLCQELRASEVDAVCFTTAIQVRSLFQYARDTHQVEAIIEAFEKNVVAVAVGKVTAEALWEEGVMNYLSPERERMGAMILELSQHYAKENKSKSCENVE